MSFRNPCPPDRSAACVDCRHRDTPGGHHETSVHFRADATIFVACGRRIRQLDDPKIGPDGKPIRKPVVGYTWNLEIVNCKECRTAVGAGAWSGAFVPARWSADPAPRGKE